MVENRKSSQFQVGTTRTARYFTLTRRKNEAGEPYGVTAALALPSAVRSSDT